MASQDPADMGEGAGSADEGAGHRDSSSSTLEVRVEGQKSDHSGSGCEGSVAEGAVEPPGSAPDVDNKPTSGVAVPVARKDEPSVRMPAALAADEEGMPIGGKDAGTLRKAEPPGGAMDGLLFKATGDAGRAWQRRLAIVAAFGLGVLVSCAAVAASVAASGGEEAGAASVIGVADPRASLPIPEAAVPRRGSSADTGGTSVKAAAAAAGPAVFGAGDCRNALQGEPCFRDVQWAMSAGIVEHPEWYPGLTASSSFAEFQALLHSEGLSTCPLPCDVPDGAGGSVGAGHWCQTHLLANLSRVGNFSVSAAGVLNVKVLTYNLFWWNLFGRRGGNGGSASSLMRAAAGPQPFDMMGFQEADDIWWPLGDAGMGEQYYASESALGMALVWRKETWRKLAGGLDHIAEDRPEQHYGRRGVLWARLQHYGTGRTVLFANHHGPLPVDTGGICGGTATAHNILRVLQSRAGVDDLVILVGDFNAGPSSPTIQTLRGHLDPVFSGTSFGGVDHLFSNGRAAVTGTRNLGPGGSDHDALMTVFQL